MVADSGAVGDVRGDAQEPVISDGVLVHTILYGVLCQRTVVSDTSDSCLSMHVQVHLDLQCFIVEEANSVATQPESTVTGRTCDRLMIDAFELFSPSKLIRNRTWRGNQGLRAPLSRETPTLTAPGPSMVARPG